MATTYTVKWGDTLWAISQKYNTTVNALAKLNNISNPDYIVVGQVLKLSGSTTQTVKTNTSTKAKITTFGLQSGSGDSSSARTVFAVWSFDRANTKEYQVKWEYSTGDGVWFIGNNGTETVKQSVYSAPANAIQVRFRVKPVAKEKSSGKAYWTGSWSDTKKYSFKDNPPSVPPKPSDITISGTKLTVTLTGLSNLNASIVQFDVAKDGSPSYKTKKVAITKTDTATFECQIAIGSEYKVKCRSNRDGIYSDWSEWSDSKGTAPATPANITECRVGSDDTSLIVKWDSVKIATEYEVQYTPTKSDFSSDTPSSDCKTISVTTNTCTITDITTGKEYFVRVRAKNANGESEWTSSSSTAIGTGPSAPTTWSSTSTIEVGEPLTLYWTHNSEDGSSATYSDLELYVNGVKTTMPTIDHTKNDGTVETESTKTYSIDTSAYENGAKLQWRVRTAGVTKSFGKWSILRIVDVYAKPEVELTLINVTGDRYGSSTSPVLTTFPFSVEASAGPDLQSAIGYSVSITSNETYQTVDNFGDPITVNEGDVIFSRQYDTVDSKAPNLFDLTISAGDVNLEDDISYTVTCEVTMNSGLSAESSITFSTAWADTEYFVDAEINVDMKTFTSTIRPYCENSRGVLIDDVLLYVYRREYDGSYTELTADVDNNSNTYVVDPHPALDYARYRVTAVNKNTGAITYNDIPGVKVGGKAIVIQWDERWSNFDVSDDSLENDDPPWSGSLLTLPYNIDISSKHEPDVALVKYIGRENPVSYYGTQHGESNTWNAEIEKSDKDTLYALRRLSKWMGNVYVREPSGVGYWANIVVSYNKNHCESTIPVSLEVTRVEGGA